MSKQHHAPTFLTSGLLNLRRLAELSGMPWPTMYGKVKGKGRYKPFTENELETLKETIKQNLEI